jgi:hypothetical protein
MNWLIVYIGIAKDGSSVTEMITEQGELDPLPNTWSPQRAIDELNVCIKKQNEGQRRVVQENAMKKQDLTTQEINFLLRSQGITVRPSYMHSDYMFTSFTMPYPLKAKLDRISKKNGLSRSRLIQMLLENCPEDNLAKYLSRL